MQISRSHSRAVCKAQVKNPIKFGFSVYNSPATTVYTTHLEEITNTWWPFGEH